MDASASALCAGNPQACDAEVAVNGHPVWYKPSQANSQRNNLKIYNSLVEEKVAFTPRDGRTVTWYTCGPTVYDVAHMGHARAYLTFDILRRVLEDYFGYEVMHQMNVTDIDDKIILKARRNKLMQLWVEPQIAAGGAALDSLAIEAKSLLTSSLASCEDKLNNIRNDLETNDYTGREKDDLEEKLKTAELKMQQARENLLKCDEAEGKDDKVAMVEAGRDVLADSLDAKHGKDVVEHSVFMQHAAKYEREFFDDLTALGVRPPTVVTRVSEYVPQIVEYIEKIIERGYAYDSNGSVYFDTRSFKLGGHCYPKLCPWAAASVEALAEGEGALSASCSEKKFQNDFALWKKSKPGEPSWDSPWGDGRPGWHIECSVMASDIIGDRLDIHAGGIDLKFPHHDNEMAQAEAYYGCKQWVDYFFHAGHLHIKGLKMSKSLKNFVTIKQALKHNSARHLRLMFLLSQWDKPIVYSDQALDDAKAKESALKNYFGAVKSFMLADDSTRTEQFWRQEERDLKLQLDTCRSTVYDSLCDNFNTGRAMTALMDLVGQCNIYLNKVKDGRWPLVKEVARFITQILKVFGVVSGNDDIGIPLSVDSELDTEAAMTPLLKALVAFRDEVRTYARENRCGPLLDICDSFRDDSCIELGIRLEDKANGPTIFKLDSPDVLRKELEEKRQKEREAAIKKRENKRKLLAKDLSKWESAAIAVEDYFTVGSYAGKYANLDDRFLPTTNASGEAISKAARKACEKEMSKHMSNRKLLLEKSNGDIESYLESIREEICRLG